MGLAHRSETDTYLPQNQVYLAGIILKVVLYSKTHTEKGKTQLKYIYMNQKKTTQVDTSIKTSERIRSAIEDDIRAGILLPGDVIDEAALARQFDVSRTPIREALLQLEAQSMLISQPRHGMVVAKMDVQQLLALWELLVEMEGVCARLACERMTDEEREELAQVHAQAQIIVDADEVDRWREANHAFHDVLYRGCRNPYLRQEILRLRARTGGYLRHAFSALGRLQSSQEQHGELLQAIQDREPARAHEMMMKHISLEQGARGLTDFLINLPKSLLNP